MNREVPGVMTVTLVADGSSDGHVLVPLITLILDTHASTPYRVDCAEPLPAGRGLSERIVHAVRMFPCDVLLVHRDAEAEEFTRRELEITAAVEEAHLAALHVKIVPVRMTEAWLLTDERAIRAAVGNPAGTGSLALPPAREVEHIPAKEVLFRAIELASELGARRLRKLNPQRYRHRVAEAILDLEPIRQVPSFCRFETALISAVRSWPHAPV